MPIEPLAVAARIKRARLDADMTQDEMADLLHVKQRTYQNYESQSAKLVRVPYRLIDQIAEATEKSAEWLLHGNGQAQVAPDRLDQLEAKLDEILARLSPPSEEEAQPSQTPTRRPKEPIRPSKRGPRKRQAGTG